MVLWKGSLPPQVSVRLLLVSATRILAGAVSETRLGGHTCTRFETFIAVQFRPVGEKKKLVSLLTDPHDVRKASTYFIEIPYCATCSKPDFHTSVTSQVLVAWRRQERKADTALPPTVNRALAWHDGRRARKECAAGRSGNRRLRTDAAAGGWKNWGGARRRWSRVKTYRTESSGEVLREP